MGCEGNPPTASVFTSEVIGVALAAGTRTAPGGVIFPKSFPKSKTHPRSRSAKLTPLIPPCKRFLSWRNTVWEFGLINLKECGLVTFGVVISNGLAPES
jgi:hypothetical protein